jgi:4-hydroxy-3-polyprenylbenzoate decarboxylase
VLRWAALQALREMPEVETHLVMSKWAKTTIELETPYTAQDVAALADVVHSPADQAATISSGSFRTDGMIVIPCSMKTLADPRGLRRRAGGPCGGCGAERGAQAGAGSP